MTTPIPPHTKDGTVPLPANDVMKMSSRPNNPIGAPHDPAGGTIHHPGTTLSHTTRAYGPEDVAVLRAQPPDGE